MEHLSLESIHKRRKEIQVALAALLRGKAVAGKPQAKQWRFFRSLAQKVLSPDENYEFIGLPPVQAAQFKFEIEDKLRRFYLRVGNTVDFVFTIVHQSDLHIYGIENNEHYPCHSGYCLLIRDMVGEYLKADDANNLPLYLERVVTESIDAEFRAYMNLPVIKTDELLQWFVPDSPAIKEILNVLSRHKLRGWLLSNTLNPSTKRLLNIKVKEIKDNVAFVNTMEYWYLRWWDQANDSYVYPYRATNRQVYVLKKDLGDWKVFENLRPMPRSSNIMRRNRRERRNQP